MRPTTPIQARPKLPSLCLVVSLALLAGSARVVAEGVPAPDPEPQLMTVRQLENVLGRRPLELIDSFNSQRNSRWLYARVRYSRLTRVTRDSMHAYVESVRRRRARQVDRRYLQYLDSGFRQASLGAGRFAIDLGHAQSWKLSVPPFTVDLELDPRYRGAMVDCYQPYGAGAVSAAFRMDEGSFAVRFGPIAGALVEAWTWVSDTEVPDFRRARYFLNLNPDYFQMFGVDRAGQLQPLCNLLAQKNSRRVRLEKLSPDQRRLYDRLRGAIERDHRARMAARAASATAP